MTDAWGAVDAGFLDAAVPAAEVLPVAIARAEELAGLDRRAYASTVSTLRAATLDRMQQQIASDRAMLRSPAGPAVSAPEA